MKEQRKLKRFLLAGFIATLVLAAPQSAYSETYFAWGDNNDGGSQPSSSGNTYGNDADVPYCITNCGGDFGGVLETPPVSGGPDYASLAGSPGPIYPYYKVNYFDGGYFRKVPTTPEEIGLSYIPNPDDESPFPTYSLSSGMAMRFVVPIPDQAVYESFGSYYKQTTTFSAAPGFSLVPLYVDTNDEDGSFYVSMLALVDAAQNLNQYENVPVFYIDNQLFEQYAFLPEYNYDGPYVHEGDVGFKQVQTYLYETNPSNPIYLPGDGTRHVFQWTGFSDSGSFGSGGGGSSVSGVSAGGGTPLSSFGIDSNNSSFNSPSAVPELPQGSMAALGLLLAGLVIYLRKRLAW